MQNRMRKTLTAKEVKMGIKNGFTVKDFCSKFNLRGEKELVEQLRHAYPHGGSEQMLREIHKNDKRKKTTVNRHKKGGIVMARANKLNELKAQENELSSEVMQLESEHKVLAQKHKDCLRKARNIKAEVDRLTTEIGRQRLKFEEVATINNEIVRDMNKISSDRAEKLASLDAVRAEINNLTTVSIAVYKDCSFEVVEGNFEGRIDLSGKETEIRTLAHNLMDKEICQNLTVKQIQTLSKLLILRSTTQTQKLEFIFDDSNLEKAHLASCQEQPLSS